MEKAILLHGFTNKELSFFIDNYLSNNQLPKVVFASTNKLIMKKQVGDWINELMEEKRNFKKSQ